jgi:hypothetical protein
MGFWMFSRKLFHIEPMSGRFSEIFAMSASERLMRQASRSEHMKVIDIVTTAIMIKSVTDTPFFNGPIVRIKNIQQSCAAGTRQAHNER